MKKIFRTVEFWKTAVMSMPDNSFFELLRSVFGKIKTPFKKQQLVNDLETFLLRDDIQKTIAAYIDQNDAKIIAAAALFGEPAPGELESFFSGEFSYAQLQDIIVNLEERFIMYRFTEDNKSRLALNPVLEQALLPFTSDIRELFPSVSAAEADADISAKISAQKTHCHPAILNDRILAGLLSFSLRETLFYRGEGVIRKRVIEAGKTCFPGVNLESVFGSLQILGLFYVDGDRLVPDKKYFENFGSLSARERMEYCAAALMVFCEQKSPTEILPPLFRGKIRETVNFIHRFLGSLDTGLLYPEKTLKRLLEILKAGMNATFISGTLFEYLEKTGLIVPASPSLLQPGAFAHNNGAESKGQSVAIDSGFTVLVYPETGYNDAIKMAFFLNIREAGAVVRFELDRDSAVRAFDESIGADEIIELLKRLSGDRVDDTLIWNLRDWEKRYNEVTLKKGVILKLSQDRRYLTETMPLAGLISETIAEGVYLLSENAIEDAAAALHAAGIDIIARRSNKKTSGEITYNYFNALPPFVLNEKISSAGTAFNADNHAAVLTANFHAILSKMPLSEAERAELSARVDRRLVLCEAQLKEASLRYEKLEARNLDYAGKQNIARQAITQQSPVEIVWTVKGKTERIFGVPKALEKDNGELVLVVVPSEVQDVMRIPLGRISLLRRIKKSIFEV